MNIKARKHCEMRWIHMATTKEWTGFHADTQWFHIKSQPSRLNNTSQPETPSIFPRSSMKKELEQHFNSRTRKKSFGAALVLCEIWAKVRTKSCIFASPSLHIFAFVAFFIFFSFKFCFRIDFLPQYFLCFWPYSLQQKKRTFFITNSF